MSSRSGNNGNAALILGGLSLLSLAGLCLFLYKSKKTIDHKNFKEHEAETDTEDSKDDAVDSEETIRLAQEAALKEAYDDALRLAKKMLLGNAFARAAVKYTEAIEMVPRIPSAKKDLTTLYNNRSAMYEKAGEFEKSLMDITSVLELDMFHIKARTRRGRLFEAQGMLSEALNEYVAVIFADRKKGENPSTIEKADEVCRYLAATKTAVRLEEMRKAAATTVLPLPMKSYCRKFFDSLPSVHHWREQFKSADREDLLSKFNAAVAVAEKEGKGVSDDTLCAVAASAVDFAHMDVSSALFSRAFATVKKALDLMPTDTEDCSPGLKAQLSALFQLRGVDLMFRRDDAGAVKAELKAIELDMNNIEAKLVLCTLYLELVMIKEADELLTSCLAQTAESKYVDDGKGEDPIVAGAAWATRMLRLNAWVMIQRSQIWIARNESGMFTQDAVTGATTELNIAMTLTSNNMDEESKRIRFVALMKTVNILLQLKIQTGIAPTEEDQERVKTCVAEAKMLFPQHEEVLMLDAEAVASEGHFDEALSMMDAIVGASDPSDTMSKIIKANILMQKAFFADQSGTQEAAMQTQRLLVEVEGLYAEAVKIEPNALEAMVQCAQLLGMTGQVDRSLEISTKAVDFTRNREEMQVLIQLILFTEAQIKVSKEME